MPITIKLEFTPKRIIESRLTDKGIMYKVIWKDSWENAFVLAMHKEEVHHVRRMLKIGDRMYYLVKWHSTWELEEDISNNVLHVFNEARDLNIKIEPDSDDDTEEMPALSILDEYNGVLFSVYCDSLCCEI